VRTRTVIVAQFSTRSLVAGAARGVDSHAFEARARAGANDVQRGIQVRARRHCADLDRGAAAATFATTEADDPH
jgi:hypothetical protein